MICSVSAVTVQPLQANRFYCSIHMLMLSRQEDFRMPLMWQTPRLCANAPAISGFTCHVSSHIFDAWPSGFLVGGRLMAWPKSAKISQEEVDALHKDHYEFLMRFHSLVSSTNRPGDCYNFLGVRGDVVI